MEKLKFNFNKKLPIILQSERAECGLACLAMISSYFGAHHSLSELRKELSIPLSGITVTKLISFASHLNLVSRPFKLDLDGLEQLKTPCILHWDMNHFVVLKYVKSNKVVIHDPVYGERNLKMSEVSNHFTGLAIEMSPNISFKKIPKKKGITLSNLWSSISGLNRSIVLIFSLSLMIQLFMLISPYYIQLVIDKVIYTSDNMLLATLAIGFGLLVIFESITSMLRATSLVHLGNSFNLQLGTNVFHHLIRLPLSYFEKRHIGDISSKFGSLREINEMMTKGVIETIIDGIMAFATLIMIFIYSPKLTLIVLIITSLYALIRVGSFQIFRKINEQELIATAEEQSNFIESLRAISTIKVFAAEQQRETLWQNYQAKAINQNIALSNFQNVFTSFKVLLFGLENIIVIYFAASLVIEGMFSLGMLFAFLTYKRHFIDRVGNLIEKTIEFKMLDLHFERLSDIVLTPKENLYSTQALTFNLNGTLEVSGVNFRYDSTTPYVLRNLSFKINKGECVAITGPSGSGKSTLFKLLLGFYQPESGEVLVDGISMDKIPLTDYRRMIGVVMQDDNLFSGTILDNITLFGHDVDIDHATYCAKVACIYEDIDNMALGFDSLVGDMGSTLSGGQKLRILIARALYKKPIILFLDEATSHLDIEIEKQISENIQKLKITRIIIAHRIETIKSADRVIEIPK